MSPLKIGGFEPGILGAVVQHARRLEGSKRRRDVLHYSTGCDEWGAVAGETQHDSYAPFSDSACSTVLGEMKHKTSQRHINRNTIHVIFVVI